MSDNPVKLLIVDDHLFFRQGIRLYLDDVVGIELVGEASNGREALEKLDSEVKIDVVLMDLQMPEMDGVKTTSEIRKNWTEVKVLVLTSFDSWDKVYKALQAGANGYVLKDIKPDELVAAINAVQAGGNYYGSEVAQKLLDRISGGNRVKEPDLPEPLTDREQEVLTLLGRGLGNKEIAGELVISEKTVKTHVSNILAKLDVNSRTQAAIFAMKNGLI